MIKECTITKLDELKMQQKFSYNKKNCNEMCISYIDTVLSKMWRLSYGHYSQVHMSIIVFILLIFLNK